MVHPKPTRRRVLGYLGTGLTAPLLSSLGCSRRLMLRSQEGGKVRLSRRVLEGWRRDFDGSVHGPGEPGFERAQAIWNQRMVNRVPGLVVRPWSTRGVAQALRLVGDHGVDVSVRGGGHSHRGFALSEGGVTIDLSGLCYSRIQPDGGLAQVGPGLTFADLDALTHRARRATTGAIVSGVGLPGYLLGGGLGWLHRMCGAGCDNLVGAELVTADAEVIETTEADPELLWAVRGGGGNFGIVTRFDLRLHRVSTVYAGLLFHRLEDAEDVSRFVDGYMDEAPAELGVWMFHRRAPNSEKIPRELRDRPVLIIGVCYAGTAASAESIVSPLQRLRRPALDSIAWRPYPKWQRALDGAWGPGLFNEWVGHHLDAFDDAARRTLFDFAEGIPSPHSDIKLARLGGALGAVGDDETAFGHRASRYALVIQSRWRESWQSARQLEWTRRLHSAMAPFGNGGVYANFIGQAPAARDDDAFTASSLARLRALKRQLDPTNTFDKNVNVSPY